MSITGQICILKGFYPQLETLGLTAHHQSNMNVGLEYRALTTACKQIPKLYSSFQCTGSVSPPANEKCCASRPTQALSTTRSAKNGI